MNLIHKIQFKAQCETFNGRKWNKIYRFLDDAFLIFVAFIPNKTFIQCLTGAQNMDLLRGMINLDGNMLSQH